MKPPPPTFQEMASVVGVGGTRTCRWKPEPRFLKTKRKPAVVWFSGQSERTRFFSQREPSDAGNVGHADQQPYRAYARFFCLGRGKLDRANAPSNESYDRQTGRQTRLCTTQSKNTQNGDDSKAQTRQEDPPSNTIRSSPVHSPNKHAAVAPPHPPCGRRKKAHTRAQFSRALVPSQNPGRRGEEGYINSAAKRAKI